MISANHGKQFYYMIKFVEKAISRRYTTDLHRKNMENLRKLNFCKNRRKDVVQQKINEDSTLECYEVLRECDIVS